MAWMFFDGYWQDPETGQMSLTDPNASAAPVAPTPQGWQIGGTVNGAPTSYYNPTVQATTNYNPSVGPGDERTAWESLFMPTLKSLADPAGGREMMRTLITASPETYAKYGIDANNIEGLLKKVEADNYDRMHNVGNDSFLDKIIQGAVPAMLGAAAFGMLPGTESLFSGFNPSSWFDSGSWLNPSGAVTEIASGSMPTNVAGWYGEAPNLDPSGIWSGNYTGPGETLLSEMAGGAATPGQISASAWYPGSTGSASGGFSMPSVGLNDILKYAGPIASLAGGVMGAGAAKDAANTQANAAREAIAAQMAMYGQTRADLTPYREVGAGALGQLRDYTSGPNAMLMKPFGMEDFQKSPAYEFNLREGERALNRGAAARNMYYAPATLKSLGDFAQGRASNEFQNAFSNYQTNMGNVWNRLSSLAGMGQNASAQMGSLGANVASNVGNNITGIGNAQAAGQVGGANAISGGISNAYNAYLMDQILSKNQSSMYGK